jgi:Xaa-Pro aminopeptidase
MNQKWVKDVRFPKRMVSGLIDIIKAMPWAKSIGIVGMNQVMRVEDYRALTSEFPTVSFDDASFLFEQVRVKKGPEELIGVEESAYILDRCFDRLLEVAQPGRTEREINAEMNRIATALGGEETLFLTMRTDLMPGTGHAGVTWGFPRDRVIRPSDAFTFSFEVTGPRGYWTEFSRIVTFQRPTEALERMAAAVSDGITSAAASIAFGVDDPVVIQDRILETAARYSVSSGYWSGHSLGLDVLEAPMSGAEVVDKDLSQSSPEKPISFGVGSVLTLHPMFWHEGEQVTGYMSDTFVVEEGACRVLSEHPLELYRLSGGSA